MKEIVFILSSLCDPHFRKRVEEFAEHGYKVKVYGYKRHNQNIQQFPVEPHILGEISNRNYLKRLRLFYTSIKSIAKECKGKLCFYSSLDIAMFARALIKSPYIYEICDLTELCVGNEILSKLLIWQNKKTVKHSYKTILTSEGFIDFFKTLPNDKIYLIPNKVSPECKPIENISRHFNPKKIKIGFVGVIRFSTIYRFIKVCVEKFDNVEIHLFGIYSDGDEYSKKIKDLEGKYDSITFHGRFANPNDLPSIYSKIDLVLCTYTPSPGVNYAEPNKLYEAIFFRCPIIVSSNTFLGTKVQRLKVGYAIDATNEDAIENFIKRLNDKSYNERITCCNSIPIEKCYNINDDFFKSI